jgi:hypothetical protein
MSISTVAPRFDHLRRLTTPLGLYEHCDGAFPLDEHGFCTDDVSRALIAVAREPDPDGELMDMAEVYLDFLHGAQRESGRFINRRTIEGEWTDKGASDDASGRAIWSLGEAAVDLDDIEQRQRAMEMFNTACEFRSPFPRSTGFAAVGAAKVVEMDPTHKGAINLLMDAAEHSRFGSHDEEWPWPEPRLTYGNALLPEAMMLIGASIDLPTYLEEGLRLLRWLVSVETSPNGWLSTSPAGGWGPGEPRPGFDQQPIEAAALADACATALSLTGDTFWGQTISKCAGWFLGVNDSRIALLNSETGGGCDGLKAYGRNNNQGAESTIAAITTLQHLRVLAMA